MQTSSPAPTGTTTDTGAVPFNVVDAITTTHLIMIAVLAVVVVIGMIYGAHLKRRRTLAQQEEQQRLDDYEEEHRDAAALGAAPTPAPPAPPEPVKTAPARQEPAPDAAPAAPGAVADRPAAGPVTQLKGLGPKVAARLAELGITSVGQIAALDDDAAQALDARLGAFQGRIARDRWVEQARFLAAGDRAGFEAVFGRL